MMKCKSLLLVISSVIVLNSTAVLGQNVTNDTTDFDIDYDIVPTTTEISVADFVICEQFVRNNVSAEIESSDFKNDTKNSEVGSSESFDIDYEKFPEIPSSEKSTLEGTCLKYKSNITDYFNNSLGSTSRPKVSFSEDTWLSEYVVTTEATPLFTRVELLEPPYSTTEDYLENSAFCGLYCVDKPNNSANDTIETFIPSTRTITEGNFLTLCPLSFEDIFQMLKNPPSQFLFKINKYGNGSQRANLTEFIQLTRNLKTIFLSMFNSLKNDIDFFQSKHILFSRIKHFQEQLVDQRKNENSELYLSSLLMEIINLNRDSKSCILLLEMQRQLYFTKQLELCIKNILNEQNYETCDAIINFTSSKLHTIRSVIQKLYKDSEQNINGILPYILHLTNSTHQIVSFETLVDSMINNNKLFNFTAIQIYDKLLQISRDTNFASSTPADFKTQLTLLNTLFQTPLETILNSWILEMKNNKFDNFALCLSKCDSCFDIILPAAGVTIIEHITKSLLERNPDKINLILNLYNKTKYSKQGVTSLYALVKELSYIRNFYTPKLFLIDNELREQSIQAIDSASFSPSRLNQVKQMITPLITVQMDHWIELIILKHFDEITGFARQYAKQFSFILPELIQNKNISKTTNNTMSVLELVQKLTDINHSILALSSLVDDLKVQNKLDSPMVFVIYNAVMELEQHNKYRPSQHLNLKTGISNTLTAAVNSECNKLANAIIGGTYQIIITLSEEHPKAFLRILNKLIQTAFSTANTEKHLMSILSFSSQLQNTAPVTSLGIIVDAMQSTGKYNSYMAFVVDDFIQYMLNSPDTSHSLKQNLRELRSKIDPVVKNQLRVFADQINNKNSQTLVYFSNNYAKAYEGVANQIFRIAVPSTSDNVYKIAMFSYHDINNLTHKALTLIAVLESVDNNYNGFYSAVFILDYYLDRLISIMTYTVPSPIRTALVQWKSRLDFQVNQQISKWSTLIQKRDLGIILGEYKQPYGQVLGQFLSKITSAVYANNKMNTMQLLELGARLPESGGYRMILYETLVSEMEMQGHLSSPVILNVKQSLDQVSYTSYKDRQSFLQTKSVVSTFFTNFLNNWASRIRHESNVNEIYEFANDNKNLAKVYFGELVVKALGSSLAHVPPLIKFLKNINDIHLLTIMLKELFSGSYSYLLRSDSHIGIAFAYLLKNKKDSSDYRILSSSDQMQWNNFISSYPSRIKTLTFHDKLCIRNEYRKEYLFACNNNYLFNDIARFVFTWRGEGRSRDFYWKLDTDDGIYFTVQNTYHGDYLDASAKEYDSERRYVSSYRDGKSYLSSYWKFQHISSDRYYIINKHYYEVLYPASNHYAFDGYRRSVFTWDANTKDSYCVWEIWNCS